MTGTQRMWLVFGLLMPIPMACGPGPEASGDRGGRLDGPVSSICTAPDAPSWVCTPPSEQSSWRYGVGTGADKDTAYHQAVVALAQNIGLQVTGMTDRQFRELVNDQHVEIQEEWRRENTASWQQTIRDATVMPPYWRAPDGAWWVRVRAPREHVLTRRIKATMTAFSEALPSDARVLVIPAFELSGVTNAFGVVVADRVSAALIKSGASVASVRRPKQGGDLDALLRTHNADILVTGTVYGDSDPITVSFEAVRPPALSEALALEVLDVPADSYVQALRLAFPTPVPDFLKVKVMSVGDGTATVRVDIQPTPLVDKRPITIRIRSDLTGYLTILSVAPDGGVTRIVPRNPNRPVAITRGVWLTIPADLPGAASGQLIASRHPSGAPERLLVVVTEDSDALPSDSFPEAVDGAMTNRLGQAALLRALQRLTQSTKRWGAHTAIYTTLVR